MQRSCHVHISFYFKYKVGSFERKATEVCHDTVMTFVIPELLVRQFALHQTQKKKKQLQNRGERSYDVPSNQSVVSRALT